MEALVSIPSQITPKGSCLMAVDLIEILEGNYKENHHGV